MGIAYLVVGGNLLAITGLSVYGTVVFAREGGPLRPLAVPLGALAGVSAYYSVRFIRSGIQFLCGPDPPSTAALDVSPSLRPVAGGPPMPAVRLRLRF
jgi:hypothetical protein